MGCGGSKVDDLPLVIRCRERKELIRAAAAHRYALASAHISYFRSLKDFGKALRRFVDEEFVIGSPLDSPVVTLPSDEGKTSKKKDIDNTSRNVAGRKNKGSSNSNSGSISHGHSAEDDCGDLHDSHLHLSSSSDSELGSSSSHIHLQDSPQIDAQEAYPPHQTAWEPYGYGVNSNPLPQSAWGPYGYGMGPSPRTDWGAYEMNVADQPYGMNVADQIYGMNYGMNAVDQHYGMNVVDQPYQTDWGQYGGNSRSYAYYMKRSAPAVCTVIHGEEPYSNSYSSYPNDSEGFFGYLMSSPRQEPPENRRPSPPAVPPPPPPPSGSGWDFLNPFDGYDTSYYSQSAYGYGSIDSSLDSNEVRKREGIPDLEEETEIEVVRDVHKGKKVNENIKRYLGTSTSKAMSPHKGEDNFKTVRSYGDSEGSPKVVPPHGSEGSSRELPSHNSDGSIKAMSSQHSEGPSKAGSSQNSKAQQSVYMEEEKSSPDTIILEASPNSYVQKKGVSFEVEEVSVNDVESSKMSSVTTLSTHGTRDILEVVGVIRDEFEMASSCGKEVALMLEVGKLPYQPKFTVLREALSRILRVVAPSSASSHPPSRQLVRVDSKTMKLARTYCEDTKYIAVVHGNISSILEELYAWEKKLYKEVKGEERLRLIYEKMCKKLKVLDDHGVESSKIDAIQVSVRKLLTKLNVSVRGIDAISSRIHKLRDEELQPQLTKLIHGLIRMWKFMLKCHQKQFRAIMESKMRTLRANTGFRRDSRLRATIELEMELRTWCSYFNDWIKSQKSYVESLNGWLLRCLHYEPEETPDGIVPFSPGRIGAPPIFVICNDWHQAMETIKESGVAYAMHHFASNLQQLWERQGEEQHHLLKTENLPKDFTKRIKTLLVDRGKLDRDQDVMSDKTVVASESGVSPHDDLKVDLDSIRKKLEEERARHKDAMKLVQDAASSSLQGGLVPIFRALEKFTSEALKAHEQVRLQNTEQGS